MTRVDQIYYSVIFVGIMAFYGIVIYVTYNQIMLDYEYDKYIEELERKV
jgi:hypothetical protein